MVDFVIIAVVLVMIAAAVVYIIKAKKSGVKCIGCPAGGTCSGNCSSQCNCGCGGTEENGI